MSTVHGEPGTAEARQSARGLLRPGSPAAFALAVVCGLCIANLYYVQPLLPNMEQSLRTSAQSLLPAVTATQIGYAVGLVLLVPLGDLWDRRKLTSTLLTATALILVVLPFTSGIALIAAFAVLGCSTVSAMVIVPWAADLAEPEQRGRVVATVMSGLIVGVLVCRAFAGVLAEAAGWRSVYWISAGLSLVCLVVVRFALPAGARSGAVRGARPSYPALLRSILTLARPKIVERAVYGALGFAAFNAFWTVLPLRLASAPFHFGPELIGLMGLLGAAGALGSTFAGRLADQHRQALATVGAFVLIGVAFAIAGIGGGLLIALIAATLLLDFGVQGAHITNQSVVYADANDARSRITTFYMTSYFIGGAIGSATGGQAWVHGGWAMTCVIGAAFPVLALIVFGLRRLFASRAATDVRT